MHIFSSTILHPLDIQPPCSDHNHRAASPAGAVKIEAAIILVPFLLLTVGAIALGFHLFVWGVLNKGAHDGINVAVKFEKLLSGGNMSTAAQQAIVSSATSLPERLSLDRDLRVEIFLPGIAGHPTKSTLLPGETIGQVLKHFPIAIRLRRPSPLPFFGFFEQELVALAIGYRESA